jgi:hypothetical protein
MDTEHHAAVICDHQHSGQRITLFGGLGQTEPVVVVPVAGVVPVAVRGTKVPRFIVPGATPQNTGAA